MSSTNDYIQQQQTTNTPQQVGSTADKYSSQPVQNGDQQTQGSGYGEEQNSSAQAPEDAVKRAEQGYSPKESGVKPSKKQPGEHVSAPGRETGTAWGQDLQTGSTTDTSGRKNPAN